MSIDSSPKDWIPETRGKQDDSCEFQSEKFVKLYRLILR